MSTATRLPTRPVRRPATPFAAPAAKAGADDPWRLLADWDGEEIVVRHDRSSGAWIFVALHRFGYPQTPWGLGRRAAGGTRMRVYPSPTEALRDVLRLSAAMTRKLAIAGLPVGGGKAVLAVTAIPTGTARRDLLLRYADVVNSLGGRFVTGPDVNTASADFDLMAERTPYVLARSVEKGGSGSSAPATALGVLHGIRAALSHVFGSADPAGRSVVVQGVGGVGGNLVELLVAAGARVSVADLDTDAVRRLSTTLGVASVPVAAALETPCDVLAPCAVGGILDESSIPRLRCAIVAGAANNQLATPDDAERLRRAGILYAPDYVINAGGAIFAGGRDLLGWDEARIDDRLQAIGVTLTEIFRRADAAGMTTDAVAEQLAVERLGGDRLAPIV